jgi:tetratricopeptide (TPR) repeat protein
VTSENPTYSNQLGVVIFHDRKSEKRTYYNLRNECTVHESDVYRYLNLGNDWIESLSKETETTISLAKRHYWAERAASQIRILLNSSNDNLIEITLKHIEETIEERSIAIDILDALLIAPLKPENNLSLLAEKALSLGLGSTASVLDSLLDNQPLIKRLSDKWLESDITFEEKHGNNKQIAWNILTKSVGLSNLLKSETQYEFQRSWNLAIFFLKSTADRKALLAAGHEIAKTLHLNKGQTDVSKLKTEIVPKEEKYHTPTITNHIAFERANKQISKIIVEIAAGNDRKGKRFIKELATSQQTTDDASEHCLKSLCNLAQQCADMFRTDFEAFCLELALKINTNDPWTLIQYGNHLKRIGDYENALASLNRANSISPNIIAKTSEADVFTQQAKYDLAIEHYHAIEGWEGDKVIRTAIADNLRKKNDLPSALRIYEELLQELGQEDSSDDQVDSFSRVRTGIAEIYKRRGQYSDAIEIYKDTLKLPNLTHSATVAHKIGLCNLLKLDSQYTAAYQIIDSLILSRPYFAEARIMRGSILGLMGKEKEGLLDLPEGTPKSWKEWLRPYYRGILLLRLRRYSEAKKSLISSLQDPTICGQEKATVRMASALFALQSKKELSKVEEMLDFDSSIQDFHGRYLYTVLKFHLAAKQNNKREFNRLRKILKAKPIKDKSLKAAIIAISKKQFREASIYETEALLKMAA